MKITLVRTEDGDWALTAGGELRGAWSDPAEALTAAVEAWAAADEPGGQRPRFRLEFLEGEETVDFRFLDVGSISFDREPPLPFMFTKERSFGHEGSTLVGVIETLNRVGENSIVLEGSFDRLDKNEAAADAVRMLSEGVMSTWSPDIGKGIGDVECKSVDEDGFCTQFVEHLTSGVLLGGTMVPFQALDSAKVILLDAEPAEVEEPEAVAAAAAVGDELLSDLLIPGSISTADGSAFVLSVTTSTNAVAASGTTTWAPPRGHFEIEEVDHLQPLTVDHVRGLVYGHLAAWNVCHTGVSDRCVLAPRSHLDYGVFHVGQVLTAEGDTLKVGRLTAGTGHAELRLGEAAARAHYDNTGNVWAVVRATDGKYGVWVCGALLPDVDEVLLARVRACALSGDWRQVGGSLELVAALSVPVPGFPLIASGGIALPEGLAVRAAFEEEDCVTLVAAGALAVERHRGDPRIEELQVELESHRAWRAKVEPVIDLLTPDAIERLVNIVTPS